MSGVTPMATEEAMIETPKFKNLKQIDPDLKPKKNNFLDSSEFVSNPTLSNLLLTLQLNLGLKVRNDTLNDTSAQETSRHFMSKDPLR